MQFSTAKLFCFLLSLLLFCSLSQGYAQQADTLRQASFWSDHALGLRVGLNYQKALAPEIGVSYHRVGGDIVSPSAQCAYLSVEWVPTILPAKESNVYGFKVGYELTGHLTVGALEVKYQSNFKEREDIVLIPKVGFGLFGSVNLLYGYHISTRKYPFDELGKHQFSLICNIDKFMIKR